MLKTGFKTSLIFALAIAALVLQAHAQSNNSLIDVLEQKGILTEKEAADLRTETATNFTQNFNQAFASKTGMAGWITGYKFYGDFTGRYEQINSVNPQYYTFNRYRYRLRIGLDIDMGDNFETGFRLGSGNPLSNPSGVLVGGSPVTEFQDVNSLSDGNFIWIDAAYGTWRPINNPDSDLSFTIGKMDNPFHLSDMVFDHNIDPVGGAAVFKRNFDDDRQNIEAIGAVYILDELNQNYQTTAAFPNVNYPVANTSAYPYMYGGQILWTSKWTPKLSSTLGLAYFDIVNKDSLSAYVQPFYNAGNTRDAYGFLVYNYNPIIVSGSLTCDLDTFPLYRGVFPVTVSGEYMNNPGAPANNIGYRFGFTLGKAGTRQTWQISYRYQELQADAWYDALPDNNNGSFYAANNYIPPTVGLPASGTPAGQMAWATTKFTGWNGFNGWYAGTNVRGHLIQATYSITDFLDVSVTYYLNNLIIGTPGQSSTSQHFFVDASWRF